MILQALTEYYEAAREKGEISPPGWGRARVAFALDLGDDGSLTALYPLKQLKTNGTKQTMVAQDMEVPMPQKRSSGVLANFLCDNAGYLLGVDAKGKPDRAQTCFAAAADLHVSLLAAVDTPAANAVKRFFASWQPEQAASHPALLQDWEELMGGANLVFYHDHRPVLEDAQIRRAWQEKYDGPADDAAVMQCLVTGKQEQIPHIHPAIKGVKDAQSVGAALVSFNSPSLESYERSQNYNAPIGRSAAFAYTTALNKLLADRERVQHIGDATVVCWAQTGESGYQDLWDMEMMGVSSETQDIAAVQRAVASIAGGQPVEWGEEMLSPNTRFYVLGLSPNAARLSVRFFWQNEFGSVLRNLQKHQEDLLIAGPPSVAGQHVPLWRLLRETVNQKAQDKSASPQLSGDMLRAILQGAAYPATLLNVVMQRIRAERDITPGRAAILKAYFLRREDPRCPKEVLTVELNDSSTYLPYLLGRLFAVLENIQQASVEGTLNTTIKDSYYNAACSTPNMAFERLFRLESAHMKKLKRTKPGLAVRLEAQVTELMGAITETLPARLIPAEQCAFHLGYYHQLQKRYEKKEEN